MTHHRNAVRPAERALQLAQADRWHEAGEVLEQALKNDNADLGDRNALITLAEMARQEARTRRIQLPATPEENQHGADRVRKQTVHPAFDLRRDFVLFSFTDTAIEEGSHVADKTVRIWSTGDQIGRRESDDRVLQIAGSPYVVDDRYENPPPLGDEWDQDDLFECSLSGVAPPAETIWKRLTGSLRRHVDLPGPGAYAIVAAWVVLTFVFPAFPAVPFLLFVGPKETGKSETLGLLATLCRCGHKSKATAAAIGDLIAARRTTFLLDQADDLPPDLEDDLTASYKLGTKRTVTDTDHRGQPHEFPIYAPKAFATHESLDDDLLDRCVRIPMSPAIRELEPLLADDDRLDRLRWQLYRFTLTNHRDLYDSPVYQDRDEVGEELGMAGRKLELWWPLEVVFDWLDAPEEDRAEAREFYATSRETTKANLDEKDEDILTALLQLRPEQGEDFSVLSPQLTEQVRSLRDRGLPSSTIGRRLKKFGLVAAKRRQRHDGSRPTEWTIDSSMLEHLADAWGLSADDEDA